MNRVTFGLVTALIVSVGWPAATSAADGQSDLGSEVLVVFALKCAGCHGPNLAKPKGRFGYVLDLARVAVVGRTERGDSGLDRGRCAQGRVG